MSWLPSALSSLFAPQPIHEAVGTGRRGRIWAPGNPGPASTSQYTADQLRVKARDLVRRNAWAYAGLDSFVSNCIGTGIKPQSTVNDAELRAAIQSLWLQWTDEADAAGLTDFYGLQALACRAMVEGGECFIRLRYRSADEDLAVPMQLQVLEAEHVPLTKNEDLSVDVRIRAGIEFDAEGRRVAYHMYPMHPEDGMLGAEGGDLQTVRIPASEIIHLYRPLRPGQIRGESWLSRALVKLNELDQYDDAELVRKKVAAMFVGFVTRATPEDSLLGESIEDGMAATSLEPGTMQYLDPGDDVRFSQPADVGGQYGVFLRTQFRAVASAMGVTYEQLTGDLSGVNYSSIRAGLVEFRRRMEMLQHTVIVHQLCRPVWNAWFDYAVLSGALMAPDYMADRRTHRACKWIPQGWAWVDPEKEIKALKAAIRAGLQSRSAAVSSFLGEDAEIVDQENAADNARADSLGLVFDSDPRNDARTIGTETVSVATDTETEPSDTTEPTTEPTTDKTP